MKWHFANNDGGRDSGFHDAGVETFKGNFDRYLARELIQNSLDARHDPNKPVMVSFELLHIPRTEIPDIESLKATFSRCAEYWGNEQKKAKAFFQRAEKVAKEKSITTLRVGDYNTKGVSGLDTDRTKTWYHLIRCAGSSSKGGGEGGSFGIGKNAPFAASQLRSVLYSTYNVQKERIFQGVATLVSHLLPQGGTAQPTGYLGSPKGASVRTESEIPSGFVRKEFGTDIYVLGFPESPSWQDDLVYSVLDNFWPAIQFEDLEVKVGSEFIRKENLASLLEKFGAKEDFTAHLYFQAYIEPSHTFHTALQQLGEVSLYVKIREQETPKRVAMVRKTGMKIFEKLFRCITPFSGVFLCRNDAGNRLLRDMEPPRHDIWDPDFPEKGINKKVEGEYVSFIRDCLRKLTPIDDSKTISIPGLNKFLPDDAETPEEPFEKPTEEGNAEEQPDRRTLPRTIVGTKIDPRKKKMQADSMDQKEGDYESEDSEGEAVGEDIGGSVHENAGNGSGSGSWGSGGNKDAQVSMGSTGGASSKPSIPIRYRTFSQNPASGTYSLTVTAERPTSKEAFLAVSTIGDDQKLVAKLVKARLISGEDVNIGPSGRIGPVKLPKGAPLRLEITLADPSSVAMEVTAYED